MTDLEMMGPRELSKLTNIKVRTITRLASEGKIPAVKVGRQWRFIRSDVEKWLKGASKVHHRILVVDDDTELLTLVSVLLSAMGHDVVAAPGGKEAQRVLARDERFSLIILDLQMPEVDGPGVLEWMASMKIEIPILIVTAYPESELMERALKYGHFTVLKKPFEPEGLRGAVEGVLGGVELAV
jgi:excisionase family DNA binding protein